MTTVDFWCDLSQQGTELLHSWEHTVGSCHAPIAGYAMLRDGELWLRGLLASRDGCDVMRGERSATVNDVAGADELGRALAGEFLERGAARLAAA